MTYVVTAAKGSALASSSGKGLDEFLRSVAANYRRDDITRIEVLFNDGTTLTLEKDKPRSPSYLRTKEPS